MHFRDVNFFLLFLATRTITSTPLLSTFETQHHPFSQHKSNKQNSQQEPNYPFPTSKGPLEKPSTFCSNIFQTEHVKKPRNPLLLQHLDVFFIFILQLGLKIFDTSIFGVNDLSTGTLLKLELIIQLLARNRCGRVVRRVTEWWKRWCGRVCLSFFLGGFQGEHGKEGLHGYTRKQCFFSRKVTNGSALRHVGAPKNGYV